MIFVFIEHALAIHIIILKTVKIVLDHAKHVMVCLQIIVLVVKMLKIENLI